LLCSAKAWKEIKKANHYSPLNFAKDLTVKSNLLELTYGNSATLRQKYQHIIKIAEQGRIFFFNVCRGFFETSIIASREIIEKVKEI